MKEGHIEPSQHSEKERGQVKECDAYNQSSDDFVEHRCGSNDTRCIHDIHGGGYAHGPEGCLKHNTWISRFVNKRHRPDGYAFKDGIHGHQSSGVLWAFDERDHGDDESCHESNRDEEENQACIARVECVDADCSGDEGGDDGDSKQITNFLHAPIEGHAFGSGDVPPEVLA